MTAIFEKKNLNSGLSTTVLKTGRCRKIWPWASSNVVAYVGGSVTEFKLWFLFASVLITCSSEKG